jgi:hypothetical protein
MALKLYWPVENLTRGFNQAYGANPQIYAQWGLPGHEGIDFYAPSGSKIFACLEGTVSVVNAPGLVGYQSGHNYGIHVRIKHSDGYETIYAHFERATVSVGDTVKASQIVGIADSTGNSTGSHLHLTLKKDGVIIDPTPYLVREFASSTPPIVGCVAVTNDRVYVRSAPKIADETALAIVDPGTQLPATHQFAANGRQWYRVTLAGSPAWVASQFAPLQGKCENPLPVWVEPTPVPEPIPEPQPEEWPTHPPAEPAPSENAALLAEIMPIFRRLVVDSVSMTSNVDDAMAVLTKYGVQQD